MKIIIASAIFCFVIALLLIKASGAGDRSSSAEPMKALTLLRENIRVGSSRSEVATFLKEHHLAFTYDSQERLYTTIVRNVSSNGIVSKNVRIKIAIDSADIVKSIKMTDVFTGP